MKFDQLGIIAPILKAVAEEGYEIPTPIQAQTIPILLEGRDLLGCAQTGTGKTAAFAIPILQILSERTHSSSHKKAIRSLILTPTRELALQIGESLACYGRHLGLRTAVIFGGVSQVAQTELLRRGIDILVATPGRLLDLIGQKYIELHHVEIFVLDEADRMLDMGFAPDVRRLIGMLPEIRQNMLFSATMPPEIISLVDKLLNEPVKVAATPVSSTVDLIDQSVCFVGKKEKKLLLIQLLKNAEMRSVLVFTKTKHGADRVTKELIKSGISVAAIHGDKSQGNRVAALSQFKQRKIRVLVATDIAARGIDVDDLSHVVNFDLPNVPETYVHRIGRTGRAGLAGKAISFCDEEEKAYLKGIHKLIGKQIAVVTDHSYPLENYAEPDLPAQNDRAAGGRSSGRPSNRATGGPTANASSVNKKAANGRAPSGSSNLKGAAGRASSSGPAANSPDTGFRRSGRATAKSDFKKTSRTTQNDSTSKKSPLSAEEFERLAYLLDGRPGHVAGKTGKRRNIGSATQTPARFSPR